jgi:hypothetical protein
MDSDIYVESPERTIRSLRGENSALTIGSARRKERIVLGTRQLPLTLG